MMMKKIWMAILILAVTPFAALAQQAAPAAGATDTESNPVSNMVRQLMERSAKNMEAAADEMPADKYSYSPSPDQITFGHLMVHVTNFNNLICSKLSGTSAPDGPKLTDTDPKDKLVPALKASYDYCAQSMAKADDSNLGEQMQLFGDRKVSRAGAMIIWASSFADHYAMAAFYLRLNKLTPPTAAPKKSSGN
jgi:DinB superfamily